MKLTKIMNDWIRIMMGVNPTGLFDKCRCYRNAAQNTINGFAKVLIDTDSYDTNNISDLGNNRITPKKTGYYQVNGHAAIFTTAGDILIITIYKNGAEHSRGGRVGSSGGGVDGEPVSDLIYCNGSTDFIELYIYCNNARVIRVGTPYAYISVVGPF